MALFLFCWGIKTHFNLEESWNQGLNLINGAENKYTNLGHRVSFSFGESVGIPLLGAEVSHFFLKNNRGTLTLRGFDLLSQNRIVQRFSELNYLREIRSNSIGRFVMLSFTYRLNQFGNQSKGVEVKMRR